MKVNTEIQLLSDGLTTMIANLMGVCISSDQFLVAIILPGEEH